MTTSKEQRFAIDAGLAMNALERCYYKVKVELNTDTIVEINRLVSSALITAIKVINPNGRPIDMENVQEYVGRITQNVVDAVQSKNFIDSDFGLEGWENDPVLWFAKFIMEEEFDRKFRSRNRDDLELFLEKEIPSAEESSKAA